MPTRKTLVVYFSRSGYTRKLATQLARALDADLDEIREAGSRGGIVGYARSVVEALLRSQPVILRPRRHPHGYRRIVIGTPVWAGHMASPVRSYLEGHRKDLQRVALFCTYGGRGAEAVLNEMAEVLDRAPLARMAVTDRALRAGDETAMAAFVKTLLHLA